MTLEADLFLMPTSIHEKGAPRPYFPYVLLVVESNSGFILGAEILAPKPSLEDMLAEVPTAFLKLLPRLGSLPTEVAVSSERALNLLTPVAAGLGLRLIRQRWLPALEEAKAAMMQFMVR